MHQLKPRLEACIKWGKPVTIRRFEVADELIAYVETVKNGFAVFELLGVSEALIVPIDDIEEILHPPLIEIRKGVFEVVKKQGPIC